VTIREWAVDSCYRRGMFPDQAAAVVAALESDEDLAELMGDRWDDDIAAYPRPFRAVLALHVDAAALCWIDAHAPGAWYRPLFDRGVPGPDVPGGGAGR
jgi:hypothetical protein